MVPDSSGQNVGQIQRQTYTVVEVAKMLGIGRGQAYEAVRRGEIPSIRLGKRLVVPKPLIERMLGAQGLGWHASPRNHRSEGR